MAARTRPLSPVSVPPTARPLTATVVACLMLLTAVGCQAPRLMEQNDALVAENLELRDELDRARAALDAAGNENDRLQQRIGQLQTEIEQMAARPAPPTPAPPTRMNNPFADLPGVETFENEGDLTVRVPGDVLFASGKVELRNESKQTLANVANVIRREFPSQTIRVEGYTDTDPIRKSGWKDNLELSLQRAAAVHRYLQEQGISPDRMYAAGFGEANPLESKARSRRVEIVVEVR